MISIIMKNKTEIKKMKKSLPEEIKEKCRFWASGNDMGLATLARNVAAYEGTPIIIIFDKDAPEQNTIDGLHYVVGTISGMDRCRVFPLIKDKKKLCVDIAAVVKDFCCRVVKHV